MAEYIEREATVELLRSLGSRDYRREKGTIQDAIKMVSYQEYTPSADVAPVVHARWEPLGEHYENCTNCGTIFEALPTQYVFEVNNKFCRNCGAKMEGE